jgi:ABC-2 type transport system permease protein
MALKQRSVFSQILASVLVNAIYAMQNYPIMFINTLLSPISILIVIVFVSHGALIGIGIEGALIMTAVMSGVSIQGDLSHLKNDLKLQDMVVTSPTSAPVYVAGMGLSEIVFSIPVLILLTILAAIYIHPTAIQALTIIAVMALMFLFSTALGFFLSTLTTDVLQSWGFSGIVTVLLSTIPPVYYPITYIPLPFRYIAYISPTTYAAQIAQASMNYIAIDPIALFVDWVIVILVCIVLLVVGYRKARWREP